MNSVQWFDKQLKGTQISVLNAYYGHINSKVRMSDKTTKKALNQYINGKKLDIPLMCQIYHEITEKVKTNIKADKDLIQTLYQKLSTINKKEFDQVINARRLTYLYKIMYRKNNNTNLIPVSNDDMQKKYILQNFCEDTLKKYVRIQVYLCGIKKHSLTIRTKLYTKILTQVSTQRKKEIIEKFCIYRNFTAQRLIEELDDEYEKMKIHTPNVKRISLDEFEIVSGIHYSISNFDMNVSILEGNNYNENSFKKEIDDYDDSDIKWYDVIIYNILDRTSHRDQNIFETEQLCILIYESKMCIKIKKRITKRIKKNL